jgi:hypothetical protein
MQRLRLIEYSRTMRHRAALDLILPHMDRQNILLGADSWG